MECEKGCGSVAGGRRRRTIEGRGTSFPHAGNPYQDGAIPAQYGALLSSAPQPVVV